MRAAVVLCDRSSRHRADPSSHTCRGHMPSDLADSAAACRHPTVAPTDAMSGCSASARLQTQVVRCPPHGVRHSISPRPCCPASWLAHRPRAAAAPRPPPAHRQPGRRPPPRPPPRPPQRARARAPSAAAWACSRPGCTPWRARRPCRETPTPSRADRRWERGRRASPCSRRTTLAPGLPRLPPSASPRPQCARTALRPRPQRPQRSRSPCRARRRHPAAARPPCSARRPA
mmetsp:Transcript_11646/g.29840  ORF Transcript_11646/g.29840 Transcript_11646/m.29840 type:complete len:231 (+) Transcript_11646:401-1093(+)